MARKLWIIGTGLLLAVVLVLFLVGRTDPPPVDPADRVPDLPPAEDLSGRRVTVLTNPPHLEAMDALADWFRAETGAVVDNVVVNYGEMLTAILDDIRSPSPRLDVVMFWYIDLGALVEASALVDLTDWIEANRPVLRVEDYVDALFAPYTEYHGRRYALPFDGDTHVLFYRPSILKRHGLSPPATWAEFSRAARTITQAERGKGIYGTAIMAPHNPMAVISTFMNRLAGFGGQLMDEEGRPTLDTPAARAALSALVAHSRHALPTPVETDWEVSRDAFLSGRLAMVEQWTDIGVMAEDPAQSTIRGDWGVVPIPRAGPDGVHRPPLNAGFSLGISTSARHPEAARSYLLFAGRPDTCLRLSMINGGVDPVRRSTLDSDAYREFAPRLAEAVGSAIASAVPWPRHPRMADLLDGLSRGIIAALEGRRSPEDALKETQARWEAVLAEPAAHRGGDGP
jgi:multiple sugar transport system substrate-binding protein